MKKPSKTEQLYALTSFRETLPPRARFTQKEFAQSHGVSVATASRWLNSSIAESLLGIEDTWPQRYFFLEPKDTQTPSTNIDEALTILSNIEENSLRRSNLASLLRWIATELERKN